MITFLFWVIACTYIYVGWLEIRYEDETTMVQNFNNLEMETIREQED